jgi:broad specificity phosphatase PhoE
VLPERIILVRHAQSEGNIDNIAYTYIPDPQIPLTAVGLQQASVVGSEPCVVSYWDGI